MRSQNVHDYSKDIKRPIQHVLSWSLNYIHIILDFLVFVLNWIYLFHWGKSFIRDKRFKWRLKNEWNGLFLPLTSIQQRKLCCIDVKGEKRVSITNEILHCTLTFSLLCLCYCLFLPCYLSHKLSSIFTNIITNN